MFLSSSRPEVTHFQIEPRLHLPVGRLGEANRAGPGDTLEARGDINAVAHEITVALLDDIAEMNTNAKFDALVVRDLGVALGHRPLNFNGSIHCIDDAAELDNRTVAGALDDPAVMHRDGRINQVAAKCPEPGKNPILVGSGKPRIADDIGH